MTENEFTDIVRKNSQRVYLIAFSITQNSSDAEDVMQNVFLKLWRYSKPFNNDEHINKWLTAVSVNESRDCIKNPFRKRRIPLDAAVNMPASDKTVNIDLFRAVMSLNTKDRMIVHLFYYEDMSVADISKIIRIKESAVKTRLFRARNKLKTILGDEWINE